MPPVRQVGLPVNRVVCGDNVEVMSKWPETCIDLVVTSPPYDNLRTYGGHSWDFEGVARELTRVLKPGGVIVWVVADATIDGSETGTSFRQALHFMELGLRLHDTMIFDKDSFQKPSHNRYWSCFEYMFVFSKGAPKSFNLIQDRENSQRGKTVNRKSVRNADGSTSTRTPVTIADFGRRKNIWPYSTGYGKGTTSKLAYQHPATFPEKLARDHIVSWSNEGDTVLDPFVGSGTTCIMSQELRRKYIGIEINPIYVEICNRRLSERQS